MKSRFYLIAGEASGDLHGAGLIRELHAQDPAADIRCWGGDKMQAAGATLVKHYRELAFMGFVEVIKHLPEILRNISFCKKDILEYRPDVLVLIDYPGFNLRIAKWAKAQGIKVVYYISPQVWAWKEGRVKAMKQHIDRMLVILPFEQDYFGKKWSWSVDYVGHPLVEVIAAEKTKPLEPVSLKPLIALLPGSRAQEVAQKLPVMLTVVKHFPDYQFAVAAAPSQPDDLYHSIIGDADVLTLRNDTYRLLRQSRAALVTSGTATLETALFGVPQIVCYRGNPISYWLARKLIKVKYISLVNLIMDRPLVKELIQDELTETSLVKELSPLLTDSIARAEMVDGYNQLWEMLGASPASARAAQAVIELAKKS